MRHPKIHCLDKGSKVYCGRFKSAVFGVIPYIFDRLQPCYQCFDCFYARAKKAKAKKEE